MVKDIIDASKWQRPIYFATSASDDGKIGLQDYFRLEGLAYLLTPIKYNYENQIDAPFVWASISKDSVVPSKEPQVGYMWRNLDNPNVYFGEQDRRMIVNYRNAFLRLAIYYNSIGDKEKLFETLQLMEKRMPRKIFPIMWQLQSDVATLYYKSGHMDEFKEYSGEVEQKAWQMINAGEGNPTQYYNPWRVLIELYQIQNNLEGQLKVLRTLSPLYPNDTGLQQRIQQLQAQLGAQSQQRPDTAKK